MKDGIYTIRGILWLTFLGTPLSGFLTIRQNLKFFGKTAHANKVTLLGILTIIVLNLLPFGLVSKTTYWIVFTVTYIGILLAVGILAVKLQGKESESYFKNGGLPRKIRSYLLLGLVSYILTFLISLLVASLMISVLPENILSAFGI